VSIELHRKIHNIIDEIDKELSVKDKVREEAIKVTRNIIRNSSECIKLILEGKYPEAKNIINNITKDVRYINNLLKRDHPDLYYSGLIYNALAEYVECNVLYDIVVNNNVRSHNDLDVPIQPYLQGLGDVIGELRRLILTSIMKERIDEAINFLKIMEYVYEALKKLHYPEALMQGIRHRVDIARRLIDDTKAFLIDIKSREELRRLILKITSH